MRILNKGKVCKHIRTDEGYVHIYPGLEEDIEKPYYKITDVIDKDKDLTIIKASKKSVKPKIKKYTNEELYKMRKADQVKLINRYGIDKIPRLEQGRVKLLLKLQE